MLIKNNIKKFFAFLSRAIVNIQKDSNLFTKIGLFLVSFIAYSALISWKFALIFLISVGFHESGHVWAMNKIGLKNKGFYFLPFLGGISLSDGECKSYGQSVFVFIMGPLWGAFLAWITIFAYWCFNIPLLAASAMWMALFNLFNLMPISLLDGGQILKAIGFSISQKIGLLFMLASTVLAAIVLLMMKVWILVIILIIGSLDLAQEVIIRYRARDKSLSKWNIFDKNPNNQIMVLNTKQLIGAIVAYIGTIIIVLMAFFLMKNIPSADLSLIFLK